MDSTVFFQTNVCGCNLCHIRHYFPVICLTKQNVTNIIFCKMFHWFINNNLKWSVGMKSCSISGILLRQPENVLYNCYQCSCCAGRNSSVNTAQIYSVFIVTAFLNFTCDIPFSVSEMDEWNWHHSNTTVFLWDDRKNLSIWGICFDINDDIFILLTTSNNITIYILTFENHPNII